MFFSVGDDIDLPVGNELCTVRDMFFSVGDDIDLPVGNK
jgi:hypothetical protein